MVPRSHTNLLGTRVWLRGPNVAIWTKSNWAGDADSPGSTELVVVGGVHVEEMWRANGSAG